MTLLRETTVSVSIPISNARLKELEKILAKAEKLEAFLSNQSLLGSRSDRSVLALDAILGASPTSNIRVSTRSMQSDGDQIETMFQVGLTATTVVVAAGEVGAMPPAAILGGGGAGLYPIGVASGGVLAAAYVGYLTGKFIADNNVVGTWWGDAFADTSVGRSVGGWFFDVATVDDSGGPQGNGSTPGVGTETDDDDADTDADTDDDDDADTDDDDDADTDDDDDADTDTDDDDEDQGDGEDGTGTPNPLDEASASAAAIMYFLSTPIGRVLENQFVRAIEMARSSGLLPPEDTPLTLAELELIFPALAARLARQKLKEIQSQIGRARGDYVSTPGIEDDPVSSDTELSVIEFILSGGGLTNPIDISAFAAIRRR